MPNTPKPTSESPRWLSSFQIFLTSRSDRLYNNGRQQIELTVLVVPSEGQTISDEQFDSISLACEAAEDDWVDLPRGASDGGESWFYQAAHDERYDYYPSLLDMAVPVYTTFRSDNSRFIRLYVHSTAAVGESIKVRASITQAPGQAHWCDQPLYPKLYTEQSPTYSFPEDYRWQRSVRCGDRLFESCPIQNDRFLVEYSLRPKHTAFSWASMPSAGLTQMMRWDEQDSTVDYATIASVVLPDSAEVVQSAHLQADTELSARVVTRPLSSTAGQIVLIAQGDPEVSRGLKSNAPHQPLMIEAYDRHGALHRLEVDFTSEKNRTDLQVSVTSDLFPVFPEFPEFKPAHITYFKVLGRGLSRDETRCRLYNNGIQQTYVRVLIEGVDDAGEVIPISNWWLWSIRLVDYYTGESLSDDYTVSLVQTEFDKRFIYHQQQPSALDPAHEKQQGRAIDFYIKAKTTANLRIAAKLQIGGKTYHTHDRNLEAGEGTTQSGRSNCSAIIESVSKDYDYSNQTSYDYSRHDVDDGSGGTYILDVDRYDLQIKAEFGRKIAYYSWGGTVAWDYIGKQKSNWFYTFAMDGRTYERIEQNGVVYHMSLPASHLCQARIKVARNWTSGETNRNVAARYDYADDYGNTHSVWVSTQNEMEILVI